MRTIIIPIAFVEKVNSLNFWGQNQQINSKQDKQPNTTTCDLWLSWPNLIRKLPHQLQLRNHLIVTNIIPIAMTSKSTLRTNSQPIQRLLVALPRSLTNQLRRLLYLLLHLTDILQLRKFTRDQTQDHILTLRQLLERFETSGSRGVVFKVISVDVQVAEELGRNGVVAAFGEVAATDKVSTAEVYADVHV